MRNLDLLIVGQGLAGTTLAHLSRARGLRVCVVSHDAFASASQVSAGLVTPVTGQRLTLSWRIAELLPFAQAFYLETQSRFAKEWWMMRPSYRVFSDALAREQWEERRRKSAEVASYAKAPTMLLEQIVGLHAPHDAAELWPSARLDVQAYLRDSRDAFVQEGEWQSGRFAWEDLHADGDHWCWGEVRARAIVSCEGAHAFVQPFWQMLPARPAHGDILTIEAPELVVPGTVHGDVFIAPLAKPGHFKVGSTYHWDRNDWAPDPSGRSEVEAKVRALLRVDYKVVAHDAGVRPIVEQRLPVIGEHPLHRGIFCFNGLASKGSLWAPFFAAQLIAHIQEGAPIEREVSLQHRLAKGARRTS